MLAIDQHNNKHARDGHVLTDSYEKKTDISAENSVFFRSLIN